MWMSVWNFLDNPLQISNPLIHHHHPEAPSALTASQMNWLLSLAAQHVCLDWTELTGCFVWRYGFFIRTSEPEGITEQMLIWTTAVSRGICTIGYVGCDSLSFSLVQLLITSWICDKTHRQNHTQHTAAWNVTVYRFPLCQPPPSNLLLISNMFSWQKPSAVLLPSAFWLDKAHWAVTHSSSGIKIFKWLHKFATNSAKVSLRQ